MTGIPTGPIDTEPLRALPWDGDNRATNRAALRDAFAGLELGSYDRSISDWIATLEPAMVATVCSWLLRARTQGGAPPLRDADPEYGDTVTTPDERVWFVVDDLQGGLLLVDPEGLGHPIAEVREGVGALTVVFRPARTETQP